jgi:hypothetical protein
MNSDTAQIPITDQGVHPREKEVLVMPSIVVTGVSSGIGRGMQFLAASSWVVLLTRSADQHQEPAEKANQPTAR